MSYLSVRNWDHYQHYKNRRPPWIKVYVELLDDLEIRRLPIGTRLLWDQLLLLAARYDNAILKDFEAIANATGIKRELVAKGTEQLLKGRWIKETRSSRTLARRYPSRAPAQSQEAEGSKTKDKGSSEVEGELGNSGATGKPDLHELGQTLENRIAAAPRGSEGRLFEVLPDFDASSAKVLRPLLDKLPVAAIEAVREEVLAAENGKRTTGYAVQILRRMVQERTTKEVA